MTKLTCVGSLPASSRSKANKWGIFILASSIFLSGCGGYSGGDLPDSDQGSNPDPEPPPIVMPPEPPLPEPLPADAIRRQAEKLDRGLVVVPGSKGNAVSWRLLGTETLTSTFEVYKNGEKVADVPVSGASFYLDSAGTADDTYAIGTVVGGSQVDMTEAVSPWQAPFLSIPLNRPAGGEAPSLDQPFLLEEYTYSANDASAADLDGDGDYEIIVKWDPSNSKDNSQSGYTGNVYIDAYTLEGEQLWRIDLGRNIRAGAHYTHFMAYDYDGDGRAEIAMKTADATIDGKGVVIGDADADHRNSTGYILAGDEFLTMFDGLSGEALHTIPYNPPRGDICTWGANPGDACYGNRVDRFLAGVAYFDEVKPSLIMSRGYYGRAVIAAYDWVDGQFSERWVFDSNNGGADAEVAQQGAHSLSIADVDADGKDEIIFGAATIDDNGQALYSTELCHGDALHVGDLDPNRPGLEVFMVHETPSCYSSSGNPAFDHGVEMHDAATGEILWSKAGNGADIGRGVTADIDPRYAGNESWASRGGYNAADGTPITNTGQGTPINFAVYWDGDALREVLDGTVIYKWDYLKETMNPILDANNYGGQSNNGTKATPALSADIFGDWREEVIWRSVTNDQLMIFSTSLPTKLRIPTLMHDSQYRVAIAWQNVAYNQPPHLSYFLGDGMQTRGESPVAEVISDWFKLTAMGDDDSISVKVRAGVELSSVEIFRDTDADPEGRVSIASLDGEYNFDDTDVVPDTTYYYWAEANGASFDTVSASLTSTLLPTVNLSARSDFETIRLLWNSQNIDVSEVRVYRADANASDPNTVPDAASRTLVQTFTEETGEWFDDASVTGQAYHYWIQIDDATSSATLESDAVWAINLERPLVPMTNLTTTQVGIDVSLTWNFQDFAPIERIELYRNTINGFGGRTRLELSVPESGSYVDETAEIGTTYWYMFKVFLDDGSSTVFNTDPEGEITIVDDGSSRTNLATETSGPDVSVSWDFVNFAPIEGIELYRNTVNDIGGRERVSESVPDSGVFVDNTVVAGTTYWYMFKVTLVGGAVVNTDAEGEVTAIAGVPTTNLATMQVGSDVVVTWDLQNYPDGTGFELYYNTVNQLGGRERLAVGLPTSGTYTHVASLDGGADFGVVPGTTYWYMFKITLPDSSRADSDPEAEITVVASGDPVTNLATEQVGSDVVVTWDLQNYPDGTGFELYYNTVNQAGGRERLAVGLPTSGTYTHVASLDGGADFGVVPGTTYWYMFKITLPDSSRADSDPEAEITVTTPSSDPVTNLATEQVGSDVVVTWDLQNYPDGTGFELYYNTVNQAGGRERLAVGLPTSGTYTHVASLDGGADFGVVPGTTYWYMFKITLPDSSRADSDPEAEITVVASGDPVTNLATEQVGSDVVVTWDLQNYPDGTGFELYYNTVNQAGGRERLAVGLPTSGTYTHVASLDGGADFGVVPGTTYWYMFKITLPDSSRADSDPEAEITVTTPSSDPVTNLATEQVGSDVVVTWDLQNYPDGTGFELYYNTVNQAGGRERLAVGLPTSGTYTHVASLDGGADFGVVPGTTYWYMFKITLPDSTRADSDPEAEITVAAP